MYRHTNKIICICLLFCIWFPSLHMWVACEAHSVVFVRFPWCVVFSFIPSFFHSNVGGNLERIHFFGCYKLLLWAFLYLFFGVHVYAFLLSMWLVVDVSSDQILFFNMNIQLTQHHLLRKRPFSITLPCQLCYKLSVQTWRDMSLGPLLC